ncbi:Olfactory Receptor 14A16 [Manis pentadactyla]|nr:Olfactory Receptor 14A16 [Manis pentadactyla]
MRSSLGLRKTLATCSSHLTVVSLFYGALIFKYFLPMSYHPPERDEVHSIFYTILTTTLNPLIYSLRNKDIARALRRLLRKEEVAVHMTYKLSSKASGTQLTGSKIIIMPEELTNVTVITEFLLMQFPENKVLPRLFFLIYVAAVTGNLIIITLTTIDQHLQSPMYFFLKNLSLIDICFISVTIPKSIINSLTSSHSISFMGCAAQVFLLICFAGTEFALLLVMSYDHYAAICHPLHYEVVMSRGVCVQMVMASWVSGSIYGSLHIAGTFSVRFCGPSTVHQFFCDVPSLLQIACSGDQILEYVFIIVGCRFAFVCFILMVVSYVYIFSTILRIPSGQGRFKCFLPVFLISLW